jgi:hypothetical protein
LSKAFTVAGSTVNDRGQKSLNLNCRAIRFACRLIFIAGWLVASTYPQSAVSVRCNPHFHKFHVSVTQIEYNPKEQSAEITIRVFGDDLENALSQHAKRAVKLDPATANKDKQVCETVLAYLRRAFELKSKTGRPVKLSWVGMEWQADMFWLYVEGKLPDGLEGAQLRNKVFQELFDDQVNIVNSKIDGKQIGLMFNPKDDFKLITAQPPAKK